MLTKIRKYRPGAGRRGTDPRIVALIGHGYRPDFPSIISVAHDAANAGRVLVYTDRPCALADYWPPEFGLDLSGGLSPPPVVLDVTALATPGHPAGAGAGAGASASAIKFAVWYDRAIPRGCPWAWGAGRPHLVDPATGHPLNAASGLLEDVPGDYAPPPGAQIISASGSEMSAALSFDVPVWLALDEYGNPPTPDDAIVFDGQPATAVVQVSPMVLQFGTSGWINPGSTWEVVRQPAWIVRPVAHPQSGAFGV